MGALVGDHVVDEGIVFVAIEQHVGGRGTAGHPDPCKGLQSRFANEQNIPARDISQGVKDGADRFGEPLHHGSFISQSHPGINHRLTKPQIKKDRRAFPRSFILSRCPKPDS